MVKVMMGQDHNHRIPMSFLGVAREGHGMVSGLGMQFVVRLKIIAVILPEALKSQHGDWKWAVCLCGQDRQSYEGDIVRGGQLTAGRQGELPTQAAWAGGSPISGKTGTISKGCHQDFQTQQLWREQRGSSAC